MSGARFLSICLVTAFLLITTSTSAKETPVIILEPSGGELFVPGQEATIKLFEKNKHKSIRIELSRDGGQTFPEVLGTVDNTAKDKTQRNVFMWTVTGSDTTEAVIRAVSTDPRKPGQGQTPEFSIGMPDISGGPLDHGELSGLLDDDHPQYLESDGSDAMSGNLNMGSNQISNLATPTNDSDAATKKYADDVLQAGTSDTAIWKTGGNGGTAPGSHFLGTTDNQALILKTNGTRVGFLGTEGPTDGPNVILGWSGNTVDPLVVGGTVFGGGRFGLANQVLGDYGAVLGGANNTVGGDDSVVAGGYSNTATTSRSFIGSGASNNVSGATSIIVGGNSNSNSGGVSFIGGGGDNAVSGDHAFLGAGFQNVASGEFSVVSGGAGNQATERITTIAGGQSNMVSANFSSIGGGQFNSISVGGNSTIAGGSSNSITASNGSIGGGNTNSVSAGSGTVAGGNSNSAIGINTAIGGGSGNTANGTSSTIAGGSSNSTLMNSASVGGGGGNQALGIASTVPGGSGNTAAGNFSFAAGRRAKTHDFSPTPISHIGAFAWADSNNFDFNTTADNEFAARATGGFRFISSIDLAGVPTKTVSISPAGDLLLPNLPTLNGHASPKQYVDSSVSTKVSRSGDTMTGTSGTDLLILDSSGGAVPNLIAFRNDGNHTGSISKEAVFSGRGVAVTSFSTSAPLTVNTAGGMAPQLIQFLNDGNVRGSISKDAFFSGRGVAVTSFSTTTPLTANTAGGQSSDIAVFKNDGNNVARVDNTGKGFFNGGTQSGGADVAEAVTILGDRSNYEAGDVLVISLAKELHFEKSSHPYSKLIAGVYATKPGVLLTERNASEDSIKDLVPMGVVGIIPTKVSAENGSIEIGDLLVSSSTPGHAMKGTEPSRMLGATIGKALQAFDGPGTGTIKVLINSN